MSKYHNPLVRNNDPFMVSSVVICRGVKCTIKELYGDMMDYFNQLDGFHYHAPVSEIEAILQR